MKTIVLNNCELYWCKLNPDRPVEPFGEKIWEMEIRTYDAKQAKEWKDHGFNVKKRSDEGKEYFRVNLKRKAIFKKKQTPAHPVQVVDGNLQPLDPAIIGNKSVGNVQITAKPWKSPIGEGTSFELKAVQVTKLLEFTPSSGNVLAFDAVGETTVATAETPPWEGDDSSDLWD